MKLRIFSGTCSFQILDHILPRTMKTFLVFILQSTVFLNPFFLGCITRTSLILGLVPCLRWTQIPCCKRSTHLHAVNNPGCYFEIRWLRLKTVRCSYIIYLDYHKRERSISTLIDTRARAHTHTHTNQPVNYNLYDSPFEY